MRRNRNCCVGPQVSVAGSLLDALRELGRVTVAPFVTFSGCRHHTAREHHFLLVLGMNMAQPQLESIEAELIRRVCGGEPQAFEELLRPYERLVYATAISILRNPTDAEEIAEEAVLKAFSKLSSFRGESRFTPGSCKSPITRPR